MTKLIPFIIATGATVYAVPTDIKVEPFKLSFAYQDDQGGLWRPGTLRGTSLELAIRPGQDWKVEWDQRYTVNPTSDNGKKPALTCMDSHFNDLGRLLKTDTTTMHQDDDAVLVEFTWAGFPAPDSKWIKMEGRLPLKIYFDKTVSEPHLIDLKQGFQFRLDGLDASITEIEKSRNNSEHLVRFNFESDDITVDIIELNFTDAEGKPLKKIKDKPPYRHAGSSWSSRDKGTNQGKTYRFAYLPEQMRLSVTYWKSIDTIEIPIDHQFSLTPQLQEDETKKQASRQSKRR